MVGREEICGALQYLIQVLKKCVDSKKVIEINGDTVSIESVLHHANMLHKKLVGEMEKVGGEDTVVLTKKAYVELMKKIEGAERRLAEEREAGYTPEAGYNTGELS